MRVVKTFSIGINNFMKVVKTFNVSEGKSKIKMQAFRSQKKEKKQMNSSSSDYPKLCLALK